MNKYARYAEITLGIFFLVSAGLKAMNVDGFGVVISAYGVIKDPSFVRAAAYASLAVETALGAAFIWGWRYKNLSFIGSTALTLVFSGLILYAWQVNGLEDCGCFGDYIKMNPPQSLAKNAVLIAIIVGTAYGLRDSEGEAFKPGIPARLISRFGVGLVVGITIFANLSAPDKPTVAVQIDATKDLSIQFTSGSQEVDLGIGQHLVVFLNTECEHCMASVPGLNELDADDTLPPMTALMLGDEDKLDIFLLETEPTFRMQLMENLTWMSFIETAPPIMYFVDDGVFQETWEWEDDPPSLDEVSATVASPAP
ncbi:MAG: MauE/DoxX family redox-associated membrane protein [Candidatus Hydrogenedentota bacterium]